jgi:hypothetical protein
MEHVEERDFTLRLELRCTFPADYDGDEDGYAWVEQFRPIAAEIARAAANAIRARPGWRVRPGNRGRPADEEVLLIVDKDVSTDSGPIAR